MLLVGQIVILLAPIFETSILFMKPSGDITPQNKTYLPDQTKQCIFLKIKTFEIFLFYVTSIITTTYFFIIIIIYIKIL